MFGNLMWFAAGLLVAAIVSIKWPEKWGTIVSLARRALWTADKVRIYVDRHRAAPVLAFLMVTIVTAAGAQDLTAPPPVVDVWYEWGLVWLMKPGVGPAIAGMIISWVVTQRYKMTLAADLAHDRRRRMTQRFSFFAAALPCFLLWPIGWMLEGMDGRDIYLVFITGVLVSVVVGCGSPFLYSIVMNQAYKRGWLSEDVWSGEARASAKQADASAQPPTL